MKITKERLTQIIKEELEGIYQEGELGHVKTPRNRGHVATDPKGLGHDSYDLSHVGKYHILNGYLAYVMSNGRVRSVNLIGPNGEAYYYQKQWVDKLTEAGYQPDESLTVPHPGASGGAHKGSGSKYDFDF